MTGSGIESGVDLLDANLRVVRSDPYFEMSGKEQISKVLPARFASVVPAYAPPQVLPSHRYRYQLESHSLLEWFDVWLEGHSLSDLQDMEPQRKR